MTQSMKKKEWTWGDEKKTIKNEDIDSPSFKLVSDLFDYELSQDFKRLDTIFKKKKTWKDKLSDLIKRK